MIKKVAETPANCTLLISNFISVDHRGRSTVKMKKDYEFKCVPLSHHIIPIIPEE